MFKAIEIIADWLWSPLAWIAIAILIVAYCP
jgi:hypothetical protein